MTRNAPLPIEAKLRFSGVFFFIADHFVCGTLILSFSDGQHSTQVRANYLEVMTDLGEEKIISYHVW